MINLQINLEPGSSACLLKDGQINWAEDQDQDGLVNLEIEFFMPSVSVLGRSINRVDGQSNGQSSL
ncbi:MAG: hypothetical protein AAFV07_02600, partial [Bacteroidota bacterium]